MLRELHIQNLAVIEDATVDLRAGLNCFTGQTGAGKSLVIGAFEVLLGLRSAGELLRAGAEEGRVTGVFELTDEATLDAVTAAADMTWDGDGRAPQTLLITRKLFSSGRTSFSLNGAPATAAMVRAVGELLVDVHGQHDHQYLLKPSNQLAMLDSFGGTTDLRDQFATVHAQLHDLKQRRAELTASATLRRQQLDLYEFQAQEIDAAEPVAGEYEELSARHRLLSNLEKVARQATAAHAALYEAEGSILERLQAVVAVLRELTELDEQLLSPAQAVRDGLAQLQDASFDLSRYLTRLDLDPAEVTEVADRLNTLNRLIHKYGSLSPDATGSLSDVIAYRRQVEAELRRLRSQSEDMATIDGQIAPLRRQLAELGGELSRRRRDAAARLKPLVEAQLAELGMAEATIEVAFEPLDATRGAVESADAASGSGGGGAAGFDAVDILLAPNPGQPPRPLRKIASGGELSRIMLGIKSIVADSDRLSVLVFDEVDSNVGGRMGAVIGGKLRGLASRHQVLCITHLPQIAAYADHHLKITKRVSRGQTRTEITPLTDESQRIDELAEMLTGKHASDTTREQARELLRLAEGNRPAPPRRPGTSSRRTARRAPATAA